jgi:hypothetical protein
MENFRRTFCPTPASPLCCIGARPTEEVRSVHYFLARTVPALSGFFDTGVWDSLPLSLAHVEPTVLHAAIALSAYHEVSVNSGLENCWSLHSSASSDHTQFASQQYTRAISLFRRCIYSNSISAPGIEILCIIFACVEFLRGDRNAALVHISGALGFLKPRQQKLLLSREEMSLKSLLARVTLTQSLYGRPRGVYFPDLLDLRKEPPRLREGKFSDLNEARMENTFLLNSALRFVRIPLPLSQPSGP